MSRTYWRSLEQAVDDPRARSFLEREFPENASEAPDGVSRREMLTLIGASVSLAGLAGCRPVEKIVPYVNAPEEIIPGIPRYFATTMPMGLESYGLVVESHEGRPTKIEGNELHPTTAGSSNVRMQASILDLYDPDRSRTVLRDGEPATWDDFVTRWAELDAAHQTDGGAGLAVLYESSRSPTLARLAETLGRRFPNAQRAVYEPVSDENLHRGIEQATGEVALPVFDFGRARVILSLDCDFLQTDGDGVSSARGFADGRRVSGVTDEMSRLWVVEGVHSLTGANADHRVRMSSERVGDFLAALAAALSAKGLNLGVPGAAPVPGLESRLLEALAGDLLAHRGAGLVVAGKRQPPAVHAAVLALNAALGNVGNTVSYVAPTDALLPDRRSLERVVGAMRDGSVSTLVVLGGNPVYNTPADLEFAAALESIENVIHLAHGVDETSRMAGWHIPRAHFLESWSDTRSADGTMSVTQPMIEPLFGGKSDVDFLGLLATGQDRPGLERLHETWGAVLDPFAFEPEWNRVLHDGLLKGSALPAVVPEVAAGAFQALADAASARGPADGGLELVFAASPAVHDGRFANNGWLQELPDSITKLTWDNAALVSPATAADLGLENETTVRLTYEGRTLELPAWIVPGQADGTVVLTLGYGRSAAGRVGNEAGANAYLLQTAAAPGFGRGATLERSGGRRPLSQTQDHGSMEGRPIVLEATLDEFREHPEFVEEELVEAPHGHSLWPDHEQTAPLQWGMAIDLNACTGCNACVVACQSENNIPVVGRREVRKGREMHWIRVDRYFNGSEEDPQIVFQAMPCMHCENAPCEQVCPVAATTHDSEGLNVMIYNRCIGTRYCSNNCPYKVRRFNFFNFTKDTPQVVRLGNNPDVTVRSRGVMEKCTYCVQRISAAKIDAKLDGREVVDGDVRTACQQACPTRAIEFGNIRDPQSRVSVAKNDPRDYTLLGELHNKPRTTFRAKLRNPHPDLDAAHQG